MDFTFGIITAAQKNESSLAWRDNMLCIFDSIRKLRIPNYEIVVVGGPFPEDGRNHLHLHKRPDVVHVPFDDNVVKEILKREGNPFLESRTLVDKNGQKHVTKIPDKDGVRMPGVLSGWITKKKNMITENAQYENIVFMHDYHMFDQNWYNGFLNFGNDWDVCMNRIENFWGDRFRDWVSWDHPQYGTRKSMPYEDVDAGKWAYISGSYWVAKKKFMEQNPLDEGFLWGQGEDLEWSFRVRDKCKYVANPMSIFRHTRPKYTVDERYAPSFAGRM